MNVSTENGPLRVKAVYAGWSSMVSSSGKIHIGHLHGEKQEQSSDSEIWMDFYLICTLQSIFLSL